MQSNGGLTDANLFQGKDAILSGPAGGIVGAVETAAQAETALFPSTWAVHPRTSRIMTANTNAHSRPLAGVRMRAPMMMIHTVPPAADRSVSLTVRAIGSARKAGPTGARLLSPRRSADGHRLQRYARQAAAGLLPERVRSEPGRAPRRRRRPSEVRSLAQEIQTATGDHRSPVEVADGYLKIAVENMANAIKKISVQRGYDVTGYTLNCFGGRAASTLASSPTLWA